MLLLNKNNLKLLITLGLIFILSTCSMFVLEQEKEADTGPSGSVNINVSHISGVLKDALSKTNQALEARSSNDRAFLVADQVYITLFNSAGAIVDSIVVTEALMDVGISLVATPGADFTVEVEIFNLDNSTLFPVATGVSVPFTIMDGANTDVSVVCLPVDYVFFPENIGSPVIDLISVPADFMSDGGDGPTDLGSETWFMVQPTTTKTTFKLIPLLESEASQIGIVYNGDGTQIGSEPMFGFMGTLVLDTIPGATYYIGVVEFDIYDGPDLVVPAGPGQIIYYPTQVYNVSGNIIIENGVAPGPGTLYISAYSYNNYIDRYDSSEYTDSIAYDGVSLNIPYTLFGVPEERDAVMAFIDEDNDGWLDESTEIYGEFNFDFPLDSHLAGADIYLYPGYDPGGGLSSDGGMDPAFSGIIGGGVHLEDQYVPGDIYIWLYDQMPDEFVEPIGETVAYNPGDGSVTYYEFANWDTNNTYYIYAEFANGEQGVQEGPISIAMALKTTVELYLNYGNSGSGLNTDGGYTGGDSFNLSGEISLFYPNETGEIYTMLFDQDPLINDNAETIAGDYFYYDGSGNGGLFYNFTNWAPLTDYYLISWLDLNSNQMPDANEQSMMIESFVVNPGDNTRNISLQLGYVSVEGGGQNDGADPAGGMIYGNVTYPAAATGRLKIGLYDEDPSNAGATTVGGISTDLNYDLSTFYDFTNWTLGTYWIIAFIDSNDNDYPDAGEYQYYSGPIGLAAAQLLNINL